MTAAERAAALVAGEPAECPRCDAILVVDTKESKPANGSRRVNCPACHYQATFAVACVTGKHGDETAVIWLERRHPALVPDPDPVPDEENVS